MAEDAARRDLDVHRAGFPIAELATRHCVSGLMAGGDGVEVLTHRLAAGARFGLVPQAEWTAFEALLVLSGRLECISEADLTLEPGDTVSAWPVRVPYVFQAIGETVLVHVSSQPQFEAGVDDIHTLKEMAREVARKDGYTHEHCLRVQTLAVALGRAARLSGESLHWLIYGAFLHDLGKVRVPAEVIQKRGALTPEEWAVMRQHPTWGREMVAGTHVASAGPIIEQHHERLDGSGYPRGLRGDEISIEAQIVAIVDTYDAITTDRPYHNAESPEAAIAELRRCAGRLFRADLVEAFVALPALHVV